MFFTYMYMHSLQDVLLFTTLLPGGGGETNHTQP